MYKIHIYLFHKWSIQTVDITSIRSEIQATFSTSGSQLNEWLESNKMTLNSSTRSVVKKNTMHHLIMSFLITSTCWGLPSVPPTCIQILQYSRILTKKKTTPRRVVSSFLIHVPNHLNWLSRIDILRAWTASADTQKKLSTASHLSMDRKLNCKVAYSATFKPYHRWIPGCLLQLTDAPHSKNVNNWLLLF